MGFDVNKFLSMEMTNKLDTERTVYPAGEYRARVKDFDLKAASTDPNADRGFNLVVNWSLDDEKLRKDFQTDDPVIRDSVWIEVDPSEGGIATGVNKNVQLGALREALKLNNEGEAFHFGMLEGKGPVMLKVETGEYQGRPTNNIAKITKVG